jgi:eukaryotic-like serine/threonine-protein kinase
MGAVWEAVDTESEGRVALKFLKSNREEDRRRFLREVRAAAAVVHPNVVKVHDVIELPDSALVMVMDLLTGETLGAVLRREKRLSLETAAAILLQVVSALAVAHAGGIVHRDLKPENVFIERDGDRISVKVLDFGVAKLTASDGLAAETQALTGTGSLIGTPYYMSPEQVLSEKDVDARADVWSLGIVLYECLTGVRPTEDENVGRVFKRIILGDFPALAERTADLPEEIEELVERMLVVDRDRRLRDLADVARVLARHAAREVSLPPAPADLQPDEALAATLLAERSAPPPANEAMSTGRSETQTALAVAPARRIGVRTGLAATVALLGGTLLLAGWRLRASGPPAATMPASPPVVAEGLASAVVVPPVAPSEDGGVSSALRVERDAVVAAPPPSPSVSGRPHSIPSGGPSSKPSATTAPPPTAAPSSEGTTPVASVSTLPNPEASSSAKPRVNFAQTPKD